MKYPYFRMTQNLDTEDQCINWFQHHKKHNTPVAIIWQHGRYSVWIIGKEVVSNNKSWGRKSNQEAIEVNSILVNEANGFMSLANLNLKKRTKVA